MGQQGELRGCHNDVKMMKSFVESQGFDPGCALVLMDDGQHQPPTSANILKGFDWLTEGAQPGDSLFMHYSGVYVVFCLSVMYCACFGCVCSLLCDGAFVGLLVVKQMCVCVCVFV